MIIALDIEGRGPSPKRNGIVSIGLCISTPDGATRQKMRFSMHPLPDQTFDEKCTREFWDQHGPLLEELTKEAEDPKIQMLTL